MGDCGCNQRRAALNRVWPGLGDLVARVAEPLRLAWLRLQVRVMAWVIRVIRHVD